MLGKSTRAKPGENENIYREIEEELDEVKMMCRTNLGGYWELAFLPCSGGFYEQPASTMERIMKLILYVNQAIHEKQEKEKSE